MEIIYKNCEYGIGIRIIGGIEFNGKLYNIFIREILPNNIAAKDGRLNEGDQLLSINDVTCLGLKKRKTIELLRSACSSGIVKLKVKKINTENERESHEQINEFMHLLELEQANLVSEEDDDENEEESTFEEDDDEVKLYDENNQESEYFTENSSNTFFNNIQQATTQQAKRKTQSEILKSQLAAFSEEREVLIKEIERLQYELMERDKNCAIVKDELYVAQQKICEHLSEIMELRSKLHQAEESQKEATKIEREYQQIIKFLKQNLKEKIGINESSLRAKSP